MNSASSYALWLPSWYPTKLTPFDGDFIQRHAKAVAEYVPVHVLHIIRDDEGKITPDIKVEQITSGNLTETIIYYNSKKKRIAPLNSFFSMKKFTSIYKEYLLKYFKENGKPFAVHVHVVYRAGLIAKWLKKEFGLNYFVTEHWTGYDRSAPDNYFNRPALFRKISKQVIRESKKILPVSNDLGQKILQIIPSISFTAIPNVVDTEFFSYKAAQPVKFRFAHYTSLQLKQKNTEGLLETLAQLKNKTAGWDCIIYGPTAPSLTTRINEMGLSELITLTGEISYPEVASILQSSSAFVSFSNFENQPCSILEALCCGLPVIASNVGGIPEIITENNGILIEPGNNTQLLQALEDMITLYPTYNRHEIALQAKEKYSYETVGKLISDLYTNS